MVKSLQRRLECASWVSLALTLLGIALFIAFSPFGHMDAQGTLHDHYGRLVLAFLVFFAGVSGMIATKLLSAILVYRRRLQRRSQRSG